MSVTAEEHVGATFFQNLLFCWLTVRNPVCAMQNLPSNSVLWRLMLWKRDVVFLLLVQLNWRLLLIPAMEELTSKVSFHPVVAKSRLSG